MVPDRYAGGARYNAIKSFRLAEGWQQPKQGGTTVGSRPSSLMRMRAFLVVEGVFLLRIKTKA